MAKPQLIKIPFALMLGTGFYFLALLAFSPKEASVVGIIAFLVVLWTNEGLPLGVVSLLPIILFPAFGIMDTGTTSQNYAKSIIFLFLGGFLVAIAVEKTGLHKVIAHRILSIFPNTVRGIIFSLAITAGLLSSFLSNTTTALLLMPLALFLSDNPGVRMRFVLAVAYGASVGGIMTPIGTPPNLILMGIMETHGLEPVAFVQWIWIVFPLAFTMFLVVGFLLSLGASQTVIAKEAVEPRLDFQQRKVLYLLLGLITLLLINAPVKPFYGGLGLDEKGILLGFGLAMFLPFINVLEWEDSRKIPFEIIFLFGAGFSIAAAFTASGLAESIAGYLLLITTLPPVALMFAIAAMATFTTEVTSNTALISMMLPVLYAVTETAGLDTTLFMMVATICASYAFMLPIATPPNAIAMASGAVHVGTMARYGIFLNLTGIVLTVTVAELIWSRFL
jgi:sodium-dependent dicarboxylate transporter 2/3/5